jgi:hypothetical protein
MGFSWAIQDRIALISCNTLTCCTYLAQKSLLVIPCVPKPLWQTANLRFAARPAKMPIKTSGIAANPVFSEGLDGFSGAQAYRDQAHRDLLLAWILLNPNPTPTENANPF